MEKNAHTYIIIFNTTIKRVLLMNNKRLFKGIFRVCSQLNIIYNLLSLYSICHDIIFQFVKKRKCVYSNAVEAGKGLKASFLFKHLYNTSRSHCEGVKKRRPKSLLRTPFLLMRNLWYQHTDTKGMGILL